MSKPSTTPEEKRQTVRRLLSTIIEIIRDERNNDIGGIPSGHLYLACMEKLNMDFDTYTMIIYALKKAGYIKEWNNVLIWVKDMPDTTQIG